MTHIEGQDDARFHEADGTHVPPQLRGETYDERLHQDVMRGRDVEWNEAEKAAFAAHLAAHDDDPRVARAAENVYLMLANVQPIDKQARIMGETPEHLRDWVEQLLYRGGAILPRKLNKDEQRIVDWTRESFWRQDFDGIDWERMIKRVFEE